MIFEVLVDAAYSKEIPEKRIQEILKKLKSLKKKYLKDPRPFPQARWQAIVGCSEHRALLEQTLKA
jgi:hypothetical protein